MTLEEKLDRCNLKGWLNPIPRLGIPAMPLGDGPFGVRDGAQLLPVPSPDEARATAFPVGVNLAATWNPGVLREVGAAIAREAAASGMAGVWGPAFNLLRTPECGRAFEYYGEDPELAGRLACAYITGMQGAGIIATAKHFACNNQEFHRFTINAVVPERALRELYWRAFERAVTEAGVWSVMAAYNKLNGAWCCENRRLLQDVLKNEWGFAGFVISDWEGVHSTEATFQAGLDVEMPPKYLTRETLRGKVAVADLDEKILRVLRALFTLGIRQPRRWLKARRAVLLKQHEPIALRAARESLVLLKNSGNLLPLDPRRVRRLLVIGENAETLRHGGGGSSAVKPPRAPAPLEALYELWPGEIDYWPGQLPTSRDEPLPTTNLTGEYYRSLDCRGQPVATRADAAPSFYWEQAGPIAGIAGDAEFAVRWTGTFTPNASGTWRLGAWTGTCEQSGLRVWLDDRLILKTWSDDLSREACRHGLLNLEADRPYRLRVEYGKRAGSPYSWVRVTGRYLGHVETPDPRQADAVILFAGTSAAFEMEAYDRPNLDLPDGQAEFIRRICRANPRTIVVLNHGGPVCWDAKAPAILWAGFPGQEGGRAIAEALLGKTNPSGKLPYTIGRRRQDWPASARDPVTEEYREGVFIGYRHFDRAQLPVLFPFGHGLSYTRFKYSALWIQGRTVRFTVTNTGRRAGAEVAQVYVEDVEASVPRPPRELKGFVKVTLKPGQSRRVTVKLDDRAFAFWDGGWRIEPGLFRIHVGSSSRDIRLTGRLRWPR
jgi:beta-glucosidase